MKLLFLAPQLPFPPHQGAAMRNWGILHHLAPSHEVHLLCFGPPDAPCPPGIASLTTVPAPTRTTLARLRDLLVHAEPDMARRLWSEPMAAALAARLRAQRFDIVQVEGIEMVPYALPYLRAGSRPRWVYDAHNAESDLQRSALRADLRLPRRWHAALYSALQVARLERYEATLLPRFDLVVAVSDEDARLLYAQSGVEPLVLPNGIDSDAVAPDRFSVAPVLQQDDAPALLFSGKMDFRPNVDGVLWFVDEILPRIQRDHAPRFWIVGQRPHPSLDRLRDHPQVVITGWVEEVEPYVRGAAVVVAPLRMGSGTRLKLLQALSLARPVVSTTLGGAGLALRSGTHALLMDEPASFAHAVSTLLDHPVDATILGEQGRAHVRAHFDWRVLVPRLEAAYDR